MLLVLPAALRSWLTMVCVCSQTSTVPKQDITHSHIQGKILVSLSVPPGALPCLGKVYPMLIREGQAFAMPYSCGSV